MPSNASKLKEQRAALPDEPGVYIFRDREGQVVYVGKAISIKKRIASHFQNPVTRGAVELVDLIDQIETVVCGSETEALLVEMEFIKRYQPRFNIRLRDDKSYPYVAVSVDEPYPRVYITRENHKPGRKYFGPYSNAKKVRQTIDLLGKLFQFRTCNGVEPGRSTGSPCLDFHIGRCSAPCIDNVTQSEYRKSIESITKFLAGNYKDVEKQLKADMKLAAKEQRFEDAARYRDRLAAVESVHDRQQVSGENLGTLDVVAVALEGDDANAQVLQVRDGALVDRHSYYLTGVSADLAEVGEQFILTHYETNTVPPLVVTHQDLVVGGALAEVLADRRRGPVEIVHPQRGAKSRLLEMAQRNSTLALGQERLREQRKQQQKVLSTGRLQDVLNTQRLPMRIECFDISHIQGTQTVASMSVCIAGDLAPSHYRSFVVKTLEEGTPDDFASMNEVLGRRVNAWEKQQVLGGDRQTIDRTVASAANPNGVDHSFAALPDLVLIDGGKGQLSAVLEPLAAFIERGTAVVSIAKREEELFLPGQSLPVLLAHDDPALQLLQRLRDEAHRFAITHHRIRRSKQQNKSILDDLEGVGPARKKALIRHFGSAQAVSEASLEALEATPDVPAKVARSIYSQMHRARTGK